MEFDSFFEKKNPKKEKRKKYALFLTSGERKELEKKAAAVGRGFSVSRYVRTLSLYADDASLKKSRSITTGLPPPSTASVSILISW